MSDLLFTLREGLTEEVSNAVLKKIKGLPDVEHASPLKGDAGRPAMRRICYARVAGLDASKRVLDILRHMPEIQDAELPPPRGLF